MNLIKSNHQKSWQLVKMSIIIFKVLSLAADCMIFGHNSNCLWPQVKTKKKPTTNQIIIIQQIRWCTNDFEILSSFSCKCQTIIGLLANELNSEWMKNGPPKLIWTRHVLISSILSVNNRRHSRNTAPRSQIKTKFKLMDYLIIFWSAAIAKIFIRTPNSFVRNVCDLLWLWKCAFGILSMFRFIQFFNWTHFRGNYLNENWNFILWIWAMDSIHFYLTKHCVVIFMSPFRKTLSKHNLLFIFPLFWYIFRFINLSIVRFIWVFVLRTRANSRPFFVLVLHICD